MSFVLGLFYIKLNLGNTLQKTYYNTNSNGKPLAYNLLEDVSFFTIYSYTKKKPKQYILRNLIFRRYCSRILALYIAELDRRQILNISRYKTLIYTVRTTTKRISPVAYIEVVLAIYDIAFIPQVQIGSNTDSVVEDPAFTTIYRYLKQYKNIIILYEAIQKQDIGQIRRLVNYLILVFFGARQLNYSRKIVYLRGLLYNSISNPDLQYTILVTITVNLSGVKNKGIAADKQ